MAQRNTRLSLINASRDEAERLLASGQADLGICQARHRSVGDAMEWRALGAIEMDFTRLKRFSPARNSRSRCWSSRSRRR